MTSWRLAQPDELAAAGDSVAEVCLDEVSAGPAADRVAPAAAADPVALGRAREAIRSRVACGRAANEVDPDVEPAGHRGVRKGNTDRNAKLPAIGDARA